MKWRNGVPYRKFKGQTGKVYWVEMTMAEVAQRDLYWVVVVLTRRVHSWPKWGPRPISGGSV